MAGKSFAGTKVAVLRGRSSIPLWGRPVSLSLEWDIPGFLITITYFDHPDNPGQPTGWHVRDDGWMCASPTMKQSLITRRNGPLRLRYLLLIHSGPVNPLRNEQLTESFSTSSRFALQKPTTPHTRWQIIRVS